MASSVHHEVPGGAKRPLQILVVDDNQPLLQFLELLLESNGFQPTAVDSPLRAAFLAQHNRYDALITDLRMPHLNGQQLLTEVRRHRFNRHLPVLFISGQSTKEFPELGDLELARYLRKPFSGADLITVLQHMIQTRTRIRHAEFLKHSSIKNESTLPDHSAHPLQATPSP